MSFSYAIILLHGTKWMLPSALILLVGPFFHGLPSTLTLFLLQLKKKIMITFVILSHTIIASNKLYQEDNTLSILQLKN